MWLSLSDLATYEIKGETSALRYLSVPVRRDDQLIAPVQSGQTGWGREWLRYAPVR